MKGVNSVPLLLGPPFYRRHQASKDITLSPTEGCASSTIDA
jgi:hypothetical protein